MPPEQSPSSNARSTGTGSTARSQHPPITAGVRGLLGLPIRKNGLLPTAPLSAPLPVHHYEQPPLPENEENDKGFHEIARDEESIEAERSAGAEPRDNFPASLPRHGALSSGVVPEHPVDQRSASPAMTLAHREHASFDIPGVSMHRTEFSALSQMPDTTKVTQPEASQEAVPDQIAPMHAPGSLPHSDEATMFDRALVTRFEHLAIEGAKARNDSETPRRSVIALSPSLVEGMGAPSGEQGDTDVARRLAQLQRVVSELAATVSRNRDENQARPRERQTPPAQRTVIIKRSDPLSTTPCAFWERSRLGRFYLRIGR